MFSGPLGHEAGTFFHGSSCPAIADGWWQALAAYTVPKAYLADWDPTFLDRGQLFFFGLWIFFCDRDMFYRNHIELSICFLR